MRLLLIFVSLFAFSTASFAAATPTNGGELEKVTIKTSAICGMCKATIEKALYALDGVENAELDVVTKKVKIKFDAEKLNAATLRQAISAAGYDADEVPARKKAYEALPGCCKKGSACDADKGEAKAAATKVVHPEGEKKACTEKKDGKACCAEGEKKACCANKEGKACKKDTKG